MERFFRILSLVALAGPLLLAGCPLGHPDAYEPNETITGFFDLGAVEGNEPEKSWTATISPKADVDFFLILAEEESGFGFPMTDELLTLTIRMVPPQAPDAHDYALCLYDEAGSLLDSSTNSGAYEETIVFTWDGVCGSSDSRDFYVEVRGVGHENSATPYTLYAHLVEEMVP
jgi:hypothetical protein